VWVAVIDIDRFKELNDELGHHQGDRFLKRCAVVWRATLRPADFLARYGGEEFVLCLPQCGAEEARGVIDRLRAVTPTERTCSAGLAVWDGTESIDSLFARADRGLYEAKERGRNGTVIASAVLPRTARERAG
jgi:diguanylate cyclase (GGDEF)-like protein